LLSLTIAFAEGEIGDSWYWFWRDWSRWWWEMCQTCVWYTIHTKVFCPLVTSKKVVKSVTEQHNSQICIAGGAWDIWEQTFIVT
jgi:hypothetical protein